ncbi:malto-oligosyltrehalose trehalohydrolase [Acidipila sp. EB88]|uniref:malto-oligosyltrehalose trehalohydrolase n=1 Tax=Acidipila sp. EB88 TaxID=2305226 RepID=UPI000F5F60D7|nr:malto-oligosyltrehalose trehalohydrolase [Acidipila sp. EB88]RRA47536.1 malto-oligosyltrehalose trehalohydrolase [Acidipila sp. EB88]
MHTFKVWAPKAETAEVKVEGKTYPLNQQDGGWWSASVDDAADGTKYVFLLDGKDQELPDPRSAFQPEGVNGPSQVVDHAKFQWADNGFRAVPFQAAIIYELHVGTFSPEGTCDGVIAKLDYLRELGVTHIELLPFAEFPGKHGWGYDGVDLFAPHAAYGGPDGLKRLVDAAHGKGLAVMMDVVYNHFGPAGNYVGQFGPYFTDQHKTPWGDAVNLEDAGSYEVRRFFCDNALMWLRDYHMDGLRLDAVHAYIDRSAINFMEQINTEVHALQVETGKPYLMIAESDLNDPRLVQPKAARGYGFDAQWSDDFHHAVVALLTGDTSGYYADFGDFADLGKALTQAFVYDGQFSEFRDRVHGRPVHDLPGWHFCGYSQNHDQVGNRAKGERLQHLTDMPRAKIAAALTLLAPFLPMLWQGEEFAASTPFLYFTDHEDKELGKLVSEGRKKEFEAFGWDPEDIPDPQDASTFEASKLKWDEVAQPEHAEMLRFYKELIALRKGQRELLDGVLDHVDVDFDDEDQWFTMQRGGIVLVFTLAEEGYSAGLDESVTLLLASDPGIQVVEGHLTMPGVGVAVLQVG